MIRDDCKTILVFALHVARVDQEFVGFEKDVLKRLTDAVQLSEQEKDELLRRKFSLGEAMGNLSGPDASEVLVKTLCAVAHADGKRHDAEFDFIRKVNAQLNEPLDLPPWEEWNRFEPEVLEALRNAQ